MQVFKSKLIGYCHGVDKTIAMAENCLKTAKKQNLPAYSIGQLIHNADTVKDFEQRGLKVIQKPEDGEKGVALIRAHGISDSLKSEFENAGYTLLDSTCANIHKSRDLMRKAFKKKRLIIVIGVKDHAESVCLMETLSENGEKMGQIFISGREDLSKLESLPRETPVSIVTQSTFPEEIYIALINRIKKKFDNIELENKLCQACILRKRKCLDLAKNVDVILVVGGKNSENTKNLAFNLRAAGKPVLCIENAGDLTEELCSTLTVYSKAGVCSGTSTPIKIVEEVCSKLEAIGQTKEN